MLKDIVKGLEPSSTLKINEISRKLEDKGEKIFKFGFGQSPFQIPTDIVNALKDNAYQNKYLPMQGLNELRDAVAKYTSVKKNTFETEYSLEQYGLSLIREENRVIVDTLQWNGSAKKSGFETGDYISEFKIENADRPNKGIIYPIAILLLIIFGYLNYRRKE